MKTIRRVLSPLMPVALPVALVALLAGCGGDEGDRPDGRPASGSLETRSVAAGIPPEPATADCQSRAGAAGLIRGFFGALNAGNRVAAERFVMDIDPATVPGHLLGFSLTDPTREPARWRASRPGPVVERMASYPRRGLRWRLERIMAFGSPGPRATDTRWRGLLPIGATAGADVEVSVGGRNASGKVGFDCRSGRFYLWGMAIGGRMMTSAERAGYDLGRPFVALDCPVPNSFRCDRLYFFFASERRIRLLGAWVDGQPVRLSPGRFSERPDRPGSVWSGTVRPAGLDDGEGPLELPSDGGSPGRWIGREPVSVPVALWVRRPSDRREWISFPRVELAAGHG